VEADSRDFSEATRSYVAAGRLVTCGRQGGGGQIRWGLLSSDGGVLALREAEQRLGRWRTISLRISGSSVRRPFRPLSIPARGLIPSFGASDQVRVIGFGLSHRRGREAGGF